MAPAHSTARRAGQVHLAVHGVRHGFFDSDLALDLAPQPGDVQQSRDEARPTLLCGFWQTRPPIQFQVISMTSRHSTTVGVRFPNELLGKMPKDAVRAACGRSVVDLQLGDYQAGIARLSALEQPGRSFAQWHVCLAAHLAEVGRYESAMDHNRRALAIAVLTI